MKCKFCFGIGEVLIDREGNIVTRLRDAVTMIPCPAGCTSELDDKTDRACPEEPEDA